MKFYDCQPAPSPRRVRIFIAEKGLDIPTVEVDLRAGEHFGDAFAAVNPHRTVPVLELDDGRRITNSAGICAYLEALHPQPALCGETPFEKAHIAEMQWRMEEQGLNAVGEVLRNRARAFRGRALTGALGFEQIPALAERGLTRIDLFFEELDALLGRHPFVAGERYSIADITALVSVDFAGWVKKRLPEEAVNARRWYEKVSARPSAQRR